MAAAKKSTVRNSGASSRSASGRGSTGTRKSAGSGKRTSTGKKTSGNKRPAARKSSGKYKRTAEEINTYKDQLAFETGITILVISIISVFFYLSFFGLCGKIGIILTGLHFGFFGWISWLMPALVVIGYVFTVVNPGDRRVPRKLISAGAFLILLGALTELILRPEILTEYFTSNHVLHHDYFQCLYMSLEDVAKYGKGSGGIIGRGIADGLSALIGKAAPEAVLFGLILLSVYIFHGLEMMASLRKRNAYKEQMEEEYGRFVQEETDYREPSYRVIPKRRQEPAATARNEASLQAVDLKAAGERLDEMEAKEKEERLAAKKQKEALKKLEKQKKKEQDAAAKAWEAAKPENRKDEADLSVPVGMQEIAGEPVEEHQHFGNASERDKQTDESMTREGLSANEPTAAEMPAKEQIKSEQKPMDIPIYREEMNHKFRGNSETETVSGETTVETGRRCLNRKRNSILIRKSRLCGKCDRNSRKCRNNRAQQAPLLPTLPQMQRQTTVI